jgi:hypothetical protein
MAKVISANDPMAGSMNENELIDFLERKDLLIHIATIDEKGEPIVSPTNYYYDRDSDKIYIITLKNLRRLLT